VVSKAILGVLRIPDGGTFELAAVLWCNGKAFESEMDRD
jgi:hypothetical protein